MPSLATPWQPVTPSVRRHKTSKAAEILEEAKRANQFYINQRWLGGMLTNFPSTVASIDKMKKKMEATLADRLIEATKKNSGRCRRKSSN